MTKKNEKEEKVKERIKKGIALCRVSSAEQARTGASLESQEQWARRKASEMRIELMDILIEDASGEKFPRESTNRILELAKKEEIGYFFIYTFDRLVRHSIYGPYCLYELWKENVQTITSWIIPDLDNPTDRLQVTFSFILAEMEQDIRIERTSRGMITKLSRGEYPLPHVPFGYERVDCKIRLIPDFKPVIKSLFETFCDVKSYAETARTINSKYGEKMGFKLHSWNVSKILHNPIYIGYIEWGGELFGDERRTS